MIVRRWCGRLNAGPHDGMTILTTEDEPPESICLNGSATYKLDTMRIQMAEPIDLTGMTKRERAHAIEAHSVHDWAEVPWAFLGAEYQWKAGA